MGLMNTIRKNPAILITMIGLAMAGFILMDMLGSGPNGGNQFVLGEVNGEQIDWKVFSETENRLYGNSDADYFERKDQLWNYFVDKIIIDEMSRDLGLGIGKAELEDLEFGTNLSPVIQRNFSDPNTRQVDREQLNSVKQAIEGDQLPAELRSFWAEQEREIIKERLQAKIAALIAKGMYVPTWQAELLNQQRNERCETAFLRIPFDKVADNEVTISDEDLKTYLKENASKFKLDEETRSVNYVAINVQPSAADSAAILAGMEALRQPFIEAENDTLFVENNYGFIDDAFYTSDFFTSEEADTIFTLPVGSVYGPFIEGSQYVMVKIRDKMIVPDSVKSRHILIQAKDPSGLAQAQSTLDSLIGVIESGAVSFDTLAFQYGQDATRTSGGDLGFTGPGQMVKPYNDLIFYKAEPGKLYTVTTQFGVHLVQVTDRKFIENKTGIRLAMLNEPIVPSEESLKREYQKALELVSRYRTLEELEKAATQAKDWMIESSGLVKANDFRLGLLGQGSAARDIIRWAFKQKSVGSVSPDVYAFEDEQLKYTNKYVVVALNRINPAGPAKLENVRTEVEMAVRNQLKGKKIAEQIAGTTNLQAISDRYAVSIDSATNINFSNTFLTGIGNEPKFVGIVTALPVGTLSKPIIGNNGVYIAQILNKPSDMPPANVALIRQQISAQRLNSASFRFAEAMRKSAKIEDNRSDFY
jgi:peptidyl-prolyl cis-trans isomerase D